MLDGCGVFGPTLDKGTGCSVPSRWRRQQMSCVKVAASRSCLPKVTRRGRSMSMMGRSSVSVDMSGTSLPASSRCTWDWCEPSASASFDGSGSSFCGWTAGSVSNWRAGLASPSTSGPFPTECPLRSHTYRWLHGWGHTTSCENESWSTCRISSTGSPSSETQFWTKGIKRARVCMAFAMSINCREVCCWILKTRYIPQCGVVLLEKLRPTCLSWCQWSRTRLKITKAFAVSDHMHLLWLSK